MITSSDSGTSSRGSSRHSVGEELIVYPTFEKYLGSQGKEMAESDRKEHHTVKEMAEPDRKEHHTAKEMLKVFQGMKASDLTYIEHQKKLWGLPHKSMP